MSAAELLVLLAAASLAIALHYTRRRARARAEGLAGYRDGAKGGAVESSAPMRWIDYPPNRSTGEWVTWRAHPACIEVASTGSGSAQLGDFILAAERAALRSEAFGIDLERSPEGQDGAPAVRIMGRIGPPQRPRHRVKLGYLPPKIVGELASIAPDIPIAAELKRAGICEQQVSIIILGLMHAGKTEREQTCPVRALAHDERASGNRQMADGRKHEAVMLRPGSERCRPDRSE